MDIFQLKELTRVIDHLASGIILHVILGSIPPPEHCSMSETGKRVKSAVKHSQNI